MSYPLLVYSAVILVGSCTSLAQDTGAEQAELHEGDIIFQTSRSGQSEAIALATASPWTHVGLLFKDKGSWNVLEAVGPVRTLPLEQWIAQGEGGRYAVKRLAKGQGGLDQEILSAMRRSGERYLGRPYDHLFMWEDERMYCSELVWKIYAEAAGVQLCAPKTLREFSLDYPVVLSTMQQRYGASIPWDEPVVAPGSLFDCPMLITVADIR